MKKLPVLLFSLLLATTNLPSASADVSVSGDAYIAVNSMYLWRGFDLSDDSSFVAQPGIDLSLGGFTASYWSNWDEETSELNETDITLDYSVDVTDLVSLSVGNIYYALDGLADTNELYLGLTLNTLLSPEFNIYYDYDEAEETGIFLTVGIGHGFDLATDVSINMGALVSYNIESDYSVGDYSNFHNAELLVSLDWEVLEGLIVSPVTVFSLPLSDDAEDISGIDDEFMAGIKLAYNF